MRSNKGYRFSRLVLVWVSIALILGCQLPSYKNTSLSQMEETLQNGASDNKAIQKNVTGNSSLPDQVKDAFLPSLLETKAKAHVAEKRFDLMAEDVPAKTFFLSLVEDTPYNITVHPQVEGKISMQLKKVTVAEVLETVRNMYGFDFRKTAQGIEILPATLQTRAFAVHYLDMNRDGDSEIQVTGSSLSSGGSSSTNGGTSTTSSSSSSSSNGQQSSDSSTIINSRIKTSSKADFWTELKLAVETIVGKGDGRTVAVSPLSSLIVVQAMPDELKKVEDFLRDADLSLNRQVILEAKILEVELNDGFQAGINWALVSGRFNATQNGGNTIGVAPNSDDTFPVLNSDNTSSDKTHNIGPAPNAAVNTATGVSAFGGVFALSTNFKNLGTFIELLGSQGKVHVLSSPRVSTLNNQPALIKVGFDRFFVTNVSTTTSTTGTSSGTTTPNVTFDSFFSGISLDVTPHITDANDVTLHIHPTISEVTDDNRTLKLGQGVGDVQYPLAKSSVRESDSMVKAKNGEMVVIGGLMQNQNAELEQGIPFFKDLPGIGRFFKHNVQITQKKELVILLRPIIIGNTTSTEQMDNSLERFHKLREEIVKDETRLDYLLK